MNLEIIAKRVASLPPHLRDVLACLSEGMSNRQIAERLGYKNRRTVGTLVYEINKKLGLERMSSRT
jgi:DNA-binding NarL/FixJ family response regulator